MSDLLAGQSFRVTSYNRAMLAFIAALEEEVGKEQADALQAESDRRGISLVSEARQWAEMEQAG